MGNQGKVRTVAWEGPAFRAGISIGAVLTSVDGQPYTDALLKTTIKTAARTRQPITLGYTSEGQAQTASIAYYGSLRYPHLERIPGQADKLALLLAPRAAAAD